MKIAVLAPSPVPFCVGGAEKLWWGITNYLNTRTTHQCELIKLPTKEHSFWDLVDSYYQYYQLDLSHFDMVISGKYPAWMAKHQNHHLYMLHCLRGLYDTYRFMNLPVDFHPTHPKIDSLCRLMTGTRLDLRRFFDALFEIKADTTIPQDTFRFPGPLIRQVVHFFDQNAMAGIRAFSAISRTVANRAEYYPAGQQVRVIYPPSSLACFRTGSYDYFFTVSRLDGPKRIRMLVDAYTGSKTQIPLKIAGSGPLERELKELAQDDDRIEFLGFVKDEELIELYANAYAVVFIPYDEDYGFITVEAMRSEKPVITFTDSGGVTEFVEDGKTGYLCRPDVSDLRSAIDRISQNPGEVVSMGKHAREKVEAITWENAVGSLLGTNRRISAFRKDRKKITVVSTYPIYPPRGGGQNRIYYLSKELSKTVDVQIICLTHENERASRKEIASNLWEIRIPKSYSHAGKEWEIQQKTGIPVTDIAMLTLHEETPDLIEEVKRSCEDSDYLVCSHPYTYPLVRSCTNKKPILDSQNTEYLLKKDMLPDSEYSRTLLETVFAAEKECCLNAHLVTVCTLDDAKAMHSLYGLNLAKVVEIPNGVNLESVTFTDPEKRMENKAKLGLKGALLALFMGSWHQPNIEAVERIFEMAEALPHVRFLIIGSVGLYFRDKQSPDNVGFLGLVDEEEKDLILSIADVALNPMASGSGTNMKMLDYMAAGIPVVSTGVGARGLNIPEGLIETADLRAFGVRIQDYLSGNITEDVVTRARNFVEEKYDWRVIGKGLADYYLTHVCAE